MSDLIDRVAKIPKYKEAFGETGNILTLAGLAAVSFATLNPLPILAGLVGEATYMIFVPDSKWYTDRLLARYDAKRGEERQLRKEQIFPTLSREMIKRYEALEQLRADIGRTAGLDNEEWFLEVQNKLDLLLDKFLEFASKEVIFKNYLKTASERVGYGFNERNYTSRNDWIKDAISCVESSYAQEIKIQTKSVESEQDDSTKAVLEKKLEILRRRKDFVSKIGKILTNLSHQIELLEETFGLISDEILARTPEQLLADIEDVVSQTNIMTNVLEDMAPFERVLN